MAAPRSGRGGPGLVLRAVGRLALLVSLGFAAGLVIGVALEEPKLLLGHLRGEGDSVRLVEAPYAEQVDSTEAVGRTGEAELGESAGSTDRVEVAANRVGAQVSGRDVQANRLALVESAEAQSSANRAVAAAPKSDRETIESEGRDRAVESDSAPSAIADGDTSRWAIQVGAFGNERVALGLVDRLTAKRYPVDLIPSDDNKHRWRVRIQPIRGKSRAQQIANRLKEEDGLPTWLILLEADAR